MGEDHEWRGVRSSLQYSSSGWYSDSRLQGHRGQCSQLLVPHVHRVLFQPPPHSTMMEDLTTALRGGMHSGFSVMKGFQCNILLGQE